MFRYLLLCVAIGAVCAEDLKINVNSDDSLGSGLKVMLRLYDDCASKDSGLSACLKMRAITFFDRAARAPEIPIMDAVTLVRSPSVPTGRAMSENDLEAILPKDNADAREGQLDTMLMDRMAKFFSSRKVQLNLPVVTGEELEQSLGEGRGKKNKGMMGMMMMGLTMKLAALLPLAIGKLFLLAGKALIVSKIALVLALILALKKILASKHDHHEVVHEHHDHGHGGWDRRAMDSAHDMAYSAHVKN